MVVGGIGGVGERHYLRNVDAGASGAEFFQQGVGADERYGDKFGVKIQFPGPQDELADGVVRPYHNDSFGAGLHQIQQGGLDRGGVAGVEAHRHRLHLAPFQGGQHPAVPRPAKGIILIQHRYPLKAEIVGETIHHFLGFQVIGSPHVHDVIPTVIAQKGGAGEGGDEWHAEGGGQRGDGAGGRRADSADEGEYAVVNQGAAVDHGGFGFIEIVQGNQGQLAPVDAAGAVGFGKGGFDAQAHIDAQLPRRAAKYRRLPEHHAVGRDAGVIGHRGGADGRRREGWGAVGVRRGRRRIGTAGGGGEQRRRQQRNGGAGGLPEKGYTAVGAD